MKVFAPFIGFFAMSGFPNLAVMTGPNPFQNRLEERQT